VSSAEHAAFFEVGASSLVLCSLSRRTSSKPSSWLAAHLAVSDLPAGLLAFSRVFDSCRAIFYVPYWALNRVFPLRALQKFCLFSSAMFTMEDHCSLSATEAGVCPATSSMSHTTLNSGFSSASDSGNYPSNCRYSEFKDTSFVRPKYWYPVIGASAILASDSHTRRIFQWPLGTRRTHFQIGTKFQYIVAVLQSSYFLFVFYYRFENWILIRSRIKEL
jgi:hypothetical protein